MTNFDSELLEALSCEPGARPEGAPSADMLQPYVLGVSQDDTAVVLEFAPAVRDLVEAFAEAERICCSVIGWAVEAEGERLRLRITAPREALALLAATWR
jgi:hypothetical protein